MVTIGAPAVGATTPRPIGVQDLVVTVPDLDRATAFFAGCFGAEVVADGGPVADPRRSTMRARANADVRAVVRGSRLLRTPFLNLRLLEATYPGQRTLWPGMLDVGGWHLAGYVDDIDAAVDFLETRVEDLYVLGPGKKPTTNAPEVGEGSFAVHGMTSWGLHFELLTYPHGRAYTADFVGRLWNPAEPDRGATPRRAAGGMPGFRGFEHLSVAVADIDEATAFLGDVLGFERFYDMGPVADPHGSGFGAYVNVDVRVRVSKVRLFRTPFLNLELIQPEFPGQQRLWPNLLDVGGWQVAFAVADLHAAVDRLLRADVHVLGEPRQDGDGTARVSCLTPFGLSFEFVQGSPPSGPGGVAPWYPARPDR